MFSAIFIVMRLVINFAKIGELTISLKNIRNIITVCAFASLLYALIDYKATKKK